MLNNKLTHETNIKKYPTINDIPHLISKTDKTLIYIPWIENMKKIRDRIQGLCYLSIKYFTLSKLLSALHIVVLFSFI